jgi:hypothetical protein
MRMLIAIVGTGVLAAVVLGALPLAWGFVALSLYLLISFAAIYDLLQPLPRIPPDEDED